MEKKSNDFYPLKKLFNGIFNSGRLKIPRHQDLQHGTKNPMSGTLAVVGLKSHTTAYHPFLGQQALRSPKSKLGTPSPKFGKKMKKKFL
jgi:hypothetical protein